MKRILKILIIVFFICNNILGQKPLITHIYAADPSAHVWKDNPNKLWVYTSHDVNGTNHHSTMFDYHVFATED